MNLLYNSDSFAVVQIELDPAAPAGQPPHDGGPASHGGYEIVDKFARKGIFLEGDVARQFRQGVEALSGNGSPSVDELDEYIAGYAVLAQQPLVLH
jgi:Protein of unknown function (DUF3567)